ncbi:MAG: Gfo/Idh/MocA family protein [Armatimonadota bacterium]
MSALGIGLIGCGQMGRSLAEAIAQRSDARLVGAADPAAEARDRAAREYGATAFEDYRGLLSQDGIGAVVIATPSHLHREVAVCAAEAGKHVFCEKPMALSVADCDAMIRAAERAGVKLMIGHVLRLMFPWWRIKELASEGELGAPVCVSIRRAHPWAGRGWRGQRELSGGPLFEVSVHELDFMRHLCGEVAQVSAYGARFVEQEAGYHDSYLINLRFRSGAIGQLHGGATAAGHFYDGRVLCPKGTLAFGPEWGTATVQRPGGEPEQLRGDGRSGPVGVDWEIESFVRCVVRDEPPIVTSSDGRAAVQLAEAAYRSMAEGRPVDIG